MKIALGQINAVIGDFSANVAQILKAYDKASLSADLVLFPEMAIPGYPPRDLLLRPQFIAENLAYLDKLASQVKGPPMIVGYVDRMEGRGPGRALRNSAAVIEKGRITHRIHKTLLPTYDVFDEDRYFEPAESNTPILLAGRKVGVTICEDIWNDEDFWPSRLYRRDPVRELKEAGAELLVNISASPWCLGKTTTRWRMIQTLACSEKLPVFYCNMVGGNDELIFDGNSLAVSATGEWLGQGRGFAEDLLLVDLSSTGNGVEFTPAVSEHDLFRALVLGLRDYVYKCGFRSVVLGLSGGIDSALTACIAVAALGRENVLGVAMPSQFSSLGSIEDAKALAENLGIRFELIPIHEQVQAFQKSLAPLFAGRAEDTTEENLQSRIRGVTLMALSNKFGSLLITTGNKSELATGYCTLYGDMCGGLAVLSDLSKMLVYDLSRWINVNPDFTGLTQGCIPTASITKPPSAELRPNQTDQDSLPPYEILDQILEGFVERHETIQELSLKFDSVLVKSLIRKIDLNEYKRRQASPGLKVTSKAFGIGRRIPIAQRYRESSL